MTKRLVARMTTMAVHDLFTKRGKVIPGIVEAKDKFRKHCMYPLSIFGSLDRHSGALQHFSYHDA